jgi:hypothetical protein
MNPPDYIISAAKRGLEFLREGFGGDGLTEGTKAAARKMASGEISEEKVILANAWGARHSVDLQAGKNNNASHEDYPGAGAVAHFLWGINPLNPQPARDWFKNKAEKIAADKKLSVGDADQNLNPMFLEAINTESLVDEQTSTIHSVSLISLGEAKGHRSDKTGSKVFVDRTTLAQVFKCCEESGTLKVKVDHGSGVFSTIGYVDKFELEESRVIGDLHIYDSEEESPKIFEIARKNPAHMGLSLEFMGMDEEMPGGCMARCDQVITAALVSDPAANSSLFFSSKETVDLHKQSVTKTINTSKNMKFETSTDPEIKPEAKMEEGDLAAMFAKHMAEYAEFKKSMAKDYPINDTAKGDDPVGEDPNISPVVKGKGSLEDADTAMGEDAPEKMESEKDKEKELKKAAQLGAELAIKAFASKMGIHLPSAGASTVPTKKSFAEIVESETKRFDGDKTKAMIHCIKTYSAEYAASRNVR